MKVKRKPRCYIKCANTGEWSGKGPPGGVPRPEDHVLEILYVTPIDSVFGGRPSTSEELAAQREQTEQEIAERAARRHAAGGGGERGEAGPWA